MYKCRSKACKDQSGSKEKSVTRPCLLPAGRGAAFGKLGFKMFPDVLGASEFLSICLHDLSQSRFIHKPWERDQTCRAEDLHMLL